MIPLTAYLVPATALLVPLVSGHGHLMAIRTEGVVYPGFNISNPTPPAVGWTTKSYPGADWAVKPPYDSGDIICHKSATNAKLSVTAKPGDNITFVWDDEWPNTHPGPILHYIAPCSGTCATVDKTTLKWVKFDQTAFVGSTWATNVFLAAGDKWTITLPNFAPGEYVIRQELISLYSASKKGGAENYPQCVNFKIVGTGTEQVPDGVLGSALYNPTDPGIFVNYNAVSPATYSMPGPPLHKFSYV